MGIKKILKLYEPQWEVEKKIFEEEKRKADERIIVIRDKKKEETENILFGLS